MNDEYQTYTSKEIAKMYKDIGVKFSSSKPSSTVTPASASITYSVINDGSEIEKKPRKFYLNNFPIYRRKADSPFNNDEYFWEYRLFEDTPYGHIINIPSSNTDVHDHGRIIIEQLNIVLNQPIVINCM